MPQITKTLKENRAIVNGISNMWTFQNHCCRKKRKGGFCVCMFSHRPKTHLEDNWSFLIAHRCECERVLLSQPLDELATCPVYHPPSPSVSWDTLQPSRRWAHLFVCQALMSCTCVCVCVIPIGHTCPCLQHSPVICSVFASLPSYLDRVWLFSLPIFSCKPAGFLLLLSNHLKLRHWWLHYLRLGPPFLSVWWIYTDTAGLKFLIWQLYGNT